jgi:hypothetical protein
MVDVTHFSIYFLHDPLGFVFTLAGHLAKIENILFCRSRKTRKSNRKYINKIKRQNYIFWILFLRELRKLRKCEYEINGIM